MWGQAEIVDETDVYENVNTRVPRQVAARVDLADFMMMFEHKLSHQQLLSSAEVQAVAAFLTLNIEEFSKLGHFELPLKVVLPRTTPVKLQWVLLAYGTCTRGICWV